MHVPKVIQYYIYTKILSEYVACIVFQLNPNCKTCFAYGIKMSSDTSFIFYLKFL